MNCDVLIIGSGAAGLATAFTAAHFGLQVIVAEKEAVFGGTTAWSGGWLWIPRNPLAKAAGIEEDIEGPLTYLRHEIGDLAQDPRILAYLENGPEMVEFFAQNSALRWIAGNKMPDFHESQGRLHGGRSVSAASFDGRKLGAMIHKLRPPLDIASLWGMGIEGGADMGHLFNATRKLRSALYAFKRILRHLADLTVHGRGMKLVNGNALVAALLRSCLDKGVRFIDSAPAIQLLRDKERVTGATLMTADEATTVHARCGVVLATGGFPHDYQRLAELARHAGSDGHGHYSAAPRSNTGDGLRLGESAGGCVSDDYVSPIALAPVSLVPQRDGHVGHFPHLIERAKPGFIAVMKNGKRFVNEADSYHDFVSALLAATPEGDKPEAWLIADHPTQRRWGLGWSKPFPLPVSAAVRSGYLKTGKTLQELALNCGIDANQFEKTVEEFNFHATRGEDPVFMRGQSRYNCTQGDLSHAPNPSLAPIIKGPFYAVHLLPGSLGTFAGLRTDMHARVLAKDASPVVGLFAVGNDMASIMGGYYPSGGITLGPAMTFGYIAGLFLSRQTKMNLDPNQFQE